MNFAAPIRTSAPLGPPAPIQLPKAETNGEISQTKKVEKERPVEMERRKEEESRETKCSGREERKEGREVTLHCVLLTQERPGTKCRVDTVCVLPQDKQMQDREKRNASC